MKAICYIILSLAFCIGAHADEKSLTFILSGASFADPRNGWFELTCEKFGIEAINKAAPGTAIRHTAQHMHAGTFYTQEELRRADALVIMHVHDANVAYTRHLKDDVNDYTLEDIKHYHTAYDYVIKKFIADCRNLKDDPLSDYYGSENGKPAVIILSTHWHDSRRTYNNAIRQVADRWDLPLIKFDDNIGFSHHVPGEDGNPSSWKYSGDRGWHPHKGKHQVIQQRMAKIFEAVVVKTFNLKPVDGP